MLDLLMILIPAMILIAGLGWWAIRDMTQRSKSVAKILLSLFALAVAGIIVIAFFGGIGVMVVALVILGYKLYKRGPQ